jgi:hypothetical protein
MALLERFIKYWPVMAKFDGNKDLFYANSLIALRNRIRAQCNYGPSHYYQVLSFF